MPKTDRSIDLLRLLRGNSGEQSGLMIVKADTANTLVFEGSATPLDLDLFEIPKDIQPIQAGKRYFTLPILTADNSQRWGILQRLD